MSKPSLILWSGAHGIQSMTNSLIQGKQWRTDIVPPLFEYFNLPTRKYASAELRIRFKSHSLHTFFFFILLTRYFLCSCGHLHLFYDFHIWIICHLIVVSYVCTQSLLIHFCPFCIDVCLFVLFFLFLSPLLTLYLQTPKIASFHASE